MHSHHSHSGQFCKHASGQLEDVIIEAIRQGFKTYGLTEHVPRYRASDLYPEEEGLDPSLLEAQFLAFLEEAHRLKHKYQDQITLLVGLETEYITTLDLDHLEKLLDEHREKIEYIIGSIHHVNGIPIDFDKPLYERAVADDLPSFLSSYFDAQYEILQRFQPEIIGHMDLCRLYTPDLKFSEYPDAWEKLERNVKYAVEYGALFEVNAAAFRKGWKTAYPGTDVFELIRRYNGRFTLSDDSHGPHAVGLNYSRLFDYLQGVDEVWVLGRQGDTVGRGLQPLEVKNWRKDTFWGSRTQ